ncbi:MAG TPA: hypothetical protein VFE79_12830 [Paraburkholderia sp.]|jgi:hypothetical protein|nr:hypothetical protein [Paraburkholderia sp.]
MHHHLFEKELAHLERVIASAPGEPFSPTYWRDRVLHLKNAPQAPMYRYRMERLWRLVCELSAVPSTIAA